MVAEYISMDANYHMKERQYQALINVEHGIGRATLGLMANQAWHDDPQRFAFTTSRYKFVAKMLSGRQNVLEVGCGDANFSRIVQQHVGRLTVTDFDPVFIQDIKNRNTDPRWELRACVHDMIAKPFPGEFDALYALDVLEHIKPAQESAFLYHIVGCLTGHGVAIIGMPSLESQKYASEQSRIGHVNCKTGANLKSTLENFFPTVFIFGMQDEVVHTGFLPMAHYLLAVCVR